MPKRLPNPPYRVSQTDFFDNEPCWDWKKGVRQIDIARQFNISQPTVSAIKIGKYWGNI